MPAYLADTVALNRHLRNKELGQASRRILLEADSGLHTIHISAVTLMEILYLSEKRRIDVHVPEVVALSRQSTNYILVPVDESVVLAAQGVDDIPELHDRLIAATAKILNLPILTNDQALTASKHITTIR